MYEEDLILLIDKNGDRIITSLDLDIVEKINSFPIKVYLARTLSDSHKLKNGNE